VDGRIDLHGMRQDRAFSALLGFLRQSQARGFRTVLVITGKGKESLDFPAGKGRGVLRQSVPAWLARPDLRDLVLGFEEAGRRHGGAGALYVRLRRRRAASRPP
jgi:DNA-nicking Smr family endonuclease